MRYKILLAGRNQSVIDDFFNQADDEFEAVTTSVRYTDIIRHLKYFEPDIFIFCTYGENMDVYNQMINIKSQLNQYQIPFILVGSKEDCEEFERATVNIPELILIKPLTIEAMTMQILNFMGVWHRMTQDVKQDVPKEQEQSQAAEEGEAAIVTVEQDKKHILVVDDSPIMLKTLKENLRENYDIATAISGKVALKFLERRKTDLILLDYEMPEESGPAVLEKIRANEDTKDIPVIFLTGVTDSGKIREALVLKPQGYLLKPINHEKLMEAITRAIG